MVKLYWMGHVNTQMRYEGTEDHLSDWPFSHLRKNTATTQCSAETTERGLAVAKIYRCVPHITPFDQL